MALLIVIVDDSKELPTTVRLNELKFRCFTQKLTSNSQTRPLLEVEMH